MEPVDHLFRRESGRMIATVARIFGLDNLSLAEDVVQDAFCRALEVWKHRGVPPNPEAWLMATAKNRALDMLRRERTAHKFAPELASEWSLVPTLEASFSPPAIKDDELRMMFSCCDPRLKEEAQVALILHLLCGFSVDEVAAAFLVSHSAMEKRLTRAKKELANTILMFDLAEEEFSTRLAAVQRALYLLFNEGYHGASPESAVRTELCHEAIRLTSIVLEYPRGAAPPTYALAALMCLHASRLATRMNAAGDLVPLFEQDRSLWDEALLQRGQFLLFKAATGEDVSEYHFEAMIATLHAEAPDLASTNWEQIVEIYDHLAARRPNPVVALNRAIAIAHLHGAERGIEEISRIENRDRLDEYPFYWAAIGELESRRGNSSIAINSYEKALALARSPAERRFLQRRIDEQQGRLSA
jgi:RNA polymerase sigma factor (sigma-70 family)